MCSLLLMSGCSTVSGGDETILSLEGSFSGPSLSQRQIFELKTDGSTLYAGTSDNLYQNITSFNTSWQPLGLPGGEVRTFVILSPETLLASLNMGNRDSLTIARTTDGGQNWRPFRNGFGAGINRAIPTAVVKNSSANGTLFAGGPGAPDIARSINRGQTWELISGTYENLGFLVFIKTDSDRIWAGGTNAAFGPLLVKSTDGGDNWEHLTVIENTDATVQDLIIDPERSRTLLAGLDGAVSPARVIRKSTDGGQNWQTVLEDIGTRTFTHSAQNPRVVYVSGRNPEGTLFFAASPDFGDTWEQVPMPNSPPGMQVNDMVSVMADGREVLYFGTNKGVYRYTFEE